MKNTKNPLQEVIEFYKHKEDWSNRLIAGDSLLVMNSLLEKEGMGGKGDNAMWMLDTDYDGRSLFPSQAFFPVAGDKEGWVALAKNLKAKIDEEK